MRYAVHRNVGYNNNHYYHYFIQPIFIFPSAISDLGFWKISLQWFSHVSLPVSPTPGLRTSTLFWALSFSSLSQAPPATSGNALYSLLSLSFSHPSPSLSPPSPFQLRRKAQCSLIDSSACSQRPGRLSWAGPVTGPEDSALKKTQHAL